ncbi:MAG: hypothetical protein ACE5HI_19450 [bacterium]
MIQITIEGLVTWRYVYACDNGTFKKNSQDPGPFIHTLGLPHELNNDTDSWDIYLANISDKEQKYTAQIKWQQDGRELHTWQKSGSLPSDSSDVKQDNAWLIGV